MKIKQCFTKLLKNRNKIYYLKFLNIFIYVHRYIKPISLFLKNIPKTFKKKNKINLF